MKKIKRINVIAIVSIIIFAFSITPITFQNDTYYTIAIGKHILENGIDMQDPFSWHENLPYTYPHWAYDTGTYIIYNLGENIGIGGFTAVYIATVVLSVILGIVVYLVNSKLSKNNIISFLVTLGVLYLLKNYIAARAQLVTFILFALTILFIENYIETNKRIFLFGLLAISTLIANIHVAVWPFYFVLFLPYIAEYIMASIIESDLFYKMQVRRFKGKIEKFYKSGKENQAIELEVQLEKIKENHLKVLEKERKRRKNPYKIKIKKGIELGLQPHLIDRYSNEMKNNQFDFIICSQHAIDKNDLYYDEYFKDKTQQKSYEIYYKTFYDIVKNFDDYSVLGHLDLIKRYGPYENSLGDSLFMDIIEAILKEVISKNKGIEINTSCFRYELPDLTPSRRIISLYKDLGGEIITTGSDAHCPSFITCKFDYIQSYLKDMGFKYICTFDNLKPNFIKL